jgi:type IX secretion system PorP/SprF family membrane protein
MNKKYNLSNMIKKAILVLVVCFFLDEASAQTEPMYSQYMYNMVAINPAYAGSRGVTGLNYFGRSQWSGISGAPKTNSVTLDGVTSNGVFGVGMQLYNDQIGVFKTNGANLMTSVRTQVSENGVLSGGIQFGIKNQVRNLTDVVNIYESNDPKFMSNMNTTDATLGMGIYYNSDNFYLGASIPNILKSSDNNLPNSPKVNNTNLFLTTGYVFDINNDIKLKPSTLVKIVSGAPIELDLNTNVWLKDFIGLGISYRTGDAVLGMAEVQLNKQLRIGYAYDYTFSALKAYTSGSNEITIRFEFGKETKNIKSTRYF